MVRLRLAMAGKHKSHFFKMVAMDQRKARDGRALEILGTYDTVESKIVVCDLVGIERWIKKGAQMSQSMKKIYKIAKKQLSSVQIEQ